MAKNLYSAGVFWNAASRMWGVSGWPGGKLTHEKLQYKTQAEAQARADNINSGKKLPQWDLGDAKP